MFVYHPCIILRLKDYGIQIPLLGQRMLNVAKWIKSEIKPEILDVPYFDQYEFTPIKKELLLAVHTKEYVETSFIEPDKTLFKTFELYDEEGNLNRYEPKKAIRELSHLHEILLKHMQGSLIATQVALDKGFSFFLGGGLHHAMSFAGRGFCHYNDIAVNSNYLINEKGFKNIWVIDTDAHKGDGSAELYQDNEKVHTLSIHQATNWPLDSERIDEKGNLHPWFIPSDIDIPITKDSNRQYNELLKVGLENLKEKFPNPDFVFVVNGADPFEEDVLESSNEIQLTKSEMLERDVLVYEFIKKTKAPMQYLMAGGYGEKVYEIYIQFLNYLKQVNNW